jgi:phosphoglycolate phosphatase
MPARFAAAVFDLDGTLVDTLPDLWAALNDLLAEIGRPPVAPDDVRLMVGEGAASLVARGLAATGDALDEPARAALVRRYVEIYAARPAAGSLPYPNALATLQRLATDGLALGVCTNKPQGLSDAVLQALGLAPLFGAVVGGDALPFRKPDPRHLTAVLDRLGVAAADTVYIGDSPTDVATARAAGVPVVAVNWGYTRIAPAALGADALIADFAALPAALARLSA